MALIPFAIVIPFWVAFPREGGSVAESYSFIALALAALVWIYALSTAVFAVKRAWILGGYLVAMFVLPVAWLCLFAFVVEKPADQQIVLIYIHSLVIFLLAVGILGATYHRSLRREWG